MDKPPRILIVDDDYTYTFMMAELLQAKGYQVHTAFDVKTGLENFDYVEVLSKLEEGMEVIVSNNYTLAHDANVKVVKKKG